MEKDKYYVFYDGDCGFCNFWVQWILKNDTQDLFRFSALQSRLGQKFLQERNLPFDKFDTLYLWKPNEFYFQKFKAVRKIAHLLGGRYAFLSHLKILPQKIEDKVYDLISNNRKSMMNAQCLLPTQEERKKFVE